MSDPPEMENVAVRSATLKSGVSRITIHGVPHQPGVAARIFREIGSHNVNVDDIIQTASEGGRNVIVSFTVEAKQTGAAQAAAEQIAQQFGTASVEVSKELARLRVVGMGMRAQSGVAAKLFEAIAAEGINVENISTSEIVISLLMPQKNGQQALQATHKAFGLDQEKN